MGAAVPDCLSFAKTGSVVKNILADSLCSISPQNEISLGNLSGSRLKGGEARLPVEQESPRSAQPLDRCRRLAERVEVLKPPVGRSSGEDLPPGGVQQSLPSLAAEWHSAQGCLCPALSESGCGGNTQGSFSRSFADGLLPARSHDPGNHAGRIRSALST